MKHPIIFFDGVCNLCNGSVQFVIEHDPEELFKFASLQSEFAQSILADQNEGIEFDTIILLKDNKIYKEADAALEVLKDIDWKWKWLGKVALVFPRFFRNGVYRIISKNRYKWFGKNESCMIPIPDLKSRFLD